MFRLNQSISKSSAKNEEKIKCEKSIQDRLMWPRDPSIIQLLTVTPKMSILTFLAAKLVQ